MNLTKEVITEKLKAIQNKFNQNVLDDKSVESYATFICHDGDGNQRSEEEKRSHLSFILYDHYRELVKDYSHIAIAKNKGGRHFIYIKRGRRALPVLEFYIWEKSKEETGKKLFDAAEAYNQIFEQKYVSGQIEFPTGDIIFSNFFHNSDCTDYAFDVPDNLEHREINSINHSLGEQNTMKILSETHGLGYVQFGNTSATVYKVDDDKLVITSSYLDYYDDEYDNEVEIFVPNSWERLGEISCEVWRIEFIDQTNFDKGDTLPLDHSNYDYNKPFRAKVSPGIWTIKNYYHFIDDNRILKQGEVPIWVEIEKKK